MTENALITSFTDPDVAATMQLYERLQPLKDALGLKDLTVAEMQLFAMVAHHTGLDPFTKQIYAIKRGGKVTHQTGIDGYRSTAERMSGQYAGSDEAIYEECECGDGGSPAKHPRKAIVIVHRLLPSGHVVNQPGVALWHELKPEHKAGQYGGFLDDMWWKMPYNQLAKCAEANGLRKAFPRVLGGVYIAEEMEQDRVIDMEPPPPRKSLEERAAEKAAAVAAVERVENTTTIVDTTTLPVYETNTTTAENTIRVRDGLTAHELVEEAKKAGKNKAHIATAIGCTLAEITERIGAMSDIERGVLADEMNLDWRAPA